MRVRGKMKLFLPLILIAVFISGCGYLPSELTGANLLPVVQTFEASPAVIKSGEYSTLRWSVTGASNVYIDNNIGDVAVKGSIAISPKDTTNYTLTASNSSGNTTVRTQIVVTGAALPHLKPPVILSFSSDKNNVDPGEAVTLYWSTSETTLVSLEPGGTVDAQGSKTVYPYVTSDYILTASNAYGIAENTLTITVNTPSSHQTGQEGVVVLSVIPEESGSLIKNNTTYTVQDTACAGDTSLNLASRAFLSFNIEGIPSNAIINEATLNFSSYTQIGNPTYTLSGWGNMGALEVYFYQYGGLSSLDTMSYSMAYNKAATLVSGGNITAYPLSPWSLDVKNSYTGEQVVQNLFQTGQSRCQFRIQFFTSTNWDGIADMFCFDDAKLTIKYTAP